MKNLKRIFALCIMIGAIYSCGKPFVPPEIDEDDQDVNITPPELIYPAPKNTKFVKVGYFPYYRDLSVAGIPDSTLLRLDVACFAFATIQNDFTVKLESPSVLMTLARRCRQLGVKVLISFNGKHDTYSRMVSQKSTREVFISSVMGIVEEYGLDGVDNDWEYPSTKNGSAQGNLYLMREFSNILHAPNVNKLLTAAIVPGKYEGSNSNGILQETFDCVDWFNIMTYDDFSTSVPGIHHSPMSLMEVAYNYWIVKRGLPTHKFVGGIPIYGRASGITQSGTTMTYKSILAQGGSPDENSAWVTSSSYNGGNTPYEVFYNGRPLVREKTRFCIDKGLGGVMFWEAGQDTHDDTSIIKTAYDEAKK